jgi:hypothetical protein
MKTTAQEEAEQFEMIGLLPGLTLAAEHAVELLNEARAALSLSPVHLDIGRSKARKEAAAAAEPEPAGGTEIHEVPKRKKGKSTAAYKRAGEATRERWAIVKEAGIKLKGSGAPTIAMVERARKILAKRQSA